MEGQTPRGPEEGEPFPAFDPDYARQQARPRPRGGGPVTPPPGTGRPTPQASPWIVGLAVAAVSVTVSIIAFGLFADPQGSSGTSTTLATDTTTPGDGTTDPTATTNPDDPDGTLTTLPGGGDDTKPPIVATGEPIPVSELTMQADGIGTLAFGTAGSIVLGRFAATFGPPTDDTGFIVGSGTWGECPGDTIRVVRWGPLNIVSRGEAATTEFVSYRIDLRYGGVTSEVTDMQTLSGLRVGDTVETLRTIYEGFDILFRVYPSIGTSFELRGSPQGDILLWGPVESEADNSRVNGIYSPDVCRTS
ncbi:MAG: hypothetical protein WEA29_07215 [Acidimicrobiia bacterium]